jgi:hypothetical protein
MVSASRCNLDIVVDSNLKRNCERNKSCDPPNGGVESIKGHYARRKIINKWVDARKAGGRRAGIPPASVIKRQAGFEKLTGADAFVTDLRADPGE